uniref:Uncharacterized protein n=1 Tax=Siphoviridae sp. ctbbV81 TaxID=2827900 RepID=A0A8S5TQM7_9CAUD|nr:MAG TPA: hypothetical protein [Siphoviridae sp. ctbbV81]DAG27231.1 MAG TPA: hypothetical protein [Caudoviricetes sp.]DAH50102.1 MAG TPA: hypothetical protein [Caudoviricetes sp.]
MLVFRITQSSEKIIKSRNKYSVNKQFSFT